MNGSYRLILIQIQEAHSKYWPTGMSDHPDLQRTFEDRVNRAKAFIQKYNIQFEVYVDPWGDPFEQTFQSWPDRYYLIDNENKVLDKSKYSYGANLMNDYTNYLKINTSK